MILKTDDRKFELVCDVCGQASHEKFDEFTDAVDFDLS